jgi:Short C-terminal domain
MKRAIVSLVIGLAGVALFTYELIHVFNIGTCASGGPFLSARPCPAGTGTVIVLLALGIILAVAGMLVGMGQTGVFIWSALFVSAGGAMLVYSITGHGGAANSTGYVLGAVFIPMGAIPLVWMLGSGAGSLRQRRLRARSKQADATVSRVDELQRYGFNQAKIRVTYAVSPLDDASFEVSQEKSTLLTFLPHVGQKVRISYDPHNHDRFEVLPSTGATSSVVQTFGGAPAEALASLAAVTRAASESAVAGAPSAIPAIPSVPAFGSAQRRDPLDRLEDLAALRDRGALSAAEFETEKAKILTEA